LTDATGWKNTTRLRRGSQLQSKQLLEIVKLALFAATVCLALHVAWTRGEEARRRAIRFFVIYIAGLSIGAGVLRVDAWPYTRYAMIMYAPENAASSDVVVRSVDRAGRERDLDPFALSPVFSTAFASWVERRLPLLDSRERADALTYAVNRAEESRLRRAAGGETGAAKWLGPFAAPPDWGLYLRPAPSGAPIEKLRIYRVSWTDKSPKRWTLLAESPAR
jgi:hypothetical protein